MKKESKKEFNVTVRIVLITERSVVANTYEEALTEANKLGVEDFIDINFAHNDSSLRIASISEGGMWATDNG